MSKIRFAVVLVFISIISGCTKRKLSNYDEFNIKYRRDNRSFETAIELHNKYINIFNVGIEDSKDNAKDTLWQEKQNLHNMSLMD